VGDKEQLHFMIPTEYVAFYEDGDSLLQRSSEMRSSHSNFWNMLFMILYHHMPQFSTEIQDGENIF